jgi:hypothetical protein
MKSKKSEEQVKDTNGIRFNIRDSWELWYLWKIWMKNEGILWLEEYEKR